MFMCSMVSDCFGSQETWTTFLCEYFQRAVRANCSYVFEGWPSTASAIVSCIIVCACRWVPAAFFETQYSLIPAIAVVLWFCNSIRVPLWNTLTWYWSPSVFAIDRRPGAWPCVFRDGDCRVRARKRWRLSDRVLDSLLPWNLYASLRKPCSLRKS